MDPTSAPGGFLGAFLLVGLLLPIVGSFVIDGVIQYFRGRSPRLLIISSALTIAIIVLAAAAWANGTVETQATDGGQAMDSMAGAIGLILCFSVPAALVGIGVRILALFLNPTTREADRALIAARTARSEERRDSRVARKRSLVARHA